MMQNWEVFDKNPITHSIPNLGVTKVLEPETAEEWDVLRYELSSFVSDGQYGSGLERILDSFLRSLGKEEQPAVWVSGFYGSGKSHLVRVLEYLWRNIPFPDGQEARSLVTLPTEVSQHLTELSTRGRQEGGLWSAAGTLGSGAGSSVRLALLGIIFRSAGLPSQYPQARLVLFLKRIGSYNALVERFRTLGEDLDFHLKNMYVSPSLATALAEIVPEFPDSVREIRELLKLQYPPKEDISDDEMLDAIEQVLALQSTRPGHLPYTLLIFDELQQYIGEDPRRTLQVQNVVETCSARFRSSVLFVATGQSALQATPQLSKLQGRFLVRVELSDADVQKVVREVVLLKKPDRVPALKAVLDRSSGEIDRQLAGTRIGSSQSDVPDLVPEYPLLPVRRRFWEGVLRVAGGGGGAGQLRTQLRMVHETTREVADRPLGTVIPGDAIYYQLETEMRQNGLLLREMQERIQRQKDGTPDGELRSRLCAAVFLISKLETEGPAATGVKPTAEMLADLLVEDLMSGGADVRARVPGLLEALVRDNTLIRVNDEYRLQTRESAEWQADYQSRYTKIRGDEPRIADERRDRLRRAVEGAVRSLSFTQGDSKTPRNFDLHFGDIRPGERGDRVPVWVRDEWSVPEGTVKAEAQYAGEDSPLVFVFLPRYEADMLRDALASALAASETLNGRAVPKTPEGIEARNAMKSRQETEELRVIGIVSEVINRALVFQGGGTQLYEGSLTANIRTAVESALVRLFPKFSMADSSGWGKVVSRASDGAPDALTAVGWTGDAKDHPVGKEILTFVGTTGKRGGEIRQHFEGPPYGWPRDAIDGALLALLSVDLNATRNGQPVNARGINQVQIGSVDFRAEDVSVPVKARIEIRAFLQQLGITCNQGQEAAGVRQGLEKLIAAAAAAGGEPPAPASPSTVALEDLRSLPGNRQILAVRERREALLQEFGQWQQRRAEIAARLPRWNTLQRMLALAGDLPAAREIRAQAEAIREQRSLLDDPDPVQPLVRQLSERLRSAVGVAREKTVEARERELRSLDAVDAWRELPHEKREELLRAHDLGPIEEDRVGTDEQLLDSLGRTSLRGWDDRTQAIPARVQAVRQALVPKAIPVSVPHATIETVEQLDEYLSQLRAVILAHIEANQPVMV